MYDRKRDDIRVQHIDGETVLLDEQNGYVHQLNDTASFVWSQCDGESSPVEIAKRLVAAFEVDEAVATRDVEGVIEQLRDLGLLC